MKFDELDKTMRVYEQSLDQCIVPDMYMVARLDGRNFTRLTRETCRFEAPFDERFRDLMLRTARHLMQCGFNIVYGYTQSDEISLPPEFGIKEVADLVGTTQTRIADLYKSKTIYHSVDKYLDFLRLMRALRILKEKPGYSIDAIAQDSGFNSVRTLQRKIQEAIGLSPGQYRDITNPE